MAETRVSLIQRVRDQTDETAWAQFFEIYHPLLTAYVRKRGVQEQDAADIVQDVFARLVPAMANFRFDAERARFRTWLWRVTQNAISDWARRRAMRSRVEQDWGDQHELVSDDASIPEWDELYRRRMLEVAIERVRAITQRATWACFEGKILSGLPAEDVAAQLGVSTNVVYVNASRVLAKVRQEVSALEDSVDSP